MLHNIVIDTEGEKWAQYFAQQHDMSEEPGAEDGDATGTHILESIQNGDCKVSMILKGMM